MVRTVKNVSSAGGRKRRSSTPPPTLPPLTLMTYLATFKPSPDASTASGSAINGGAVKSAIKNPSSGRVNVLNNIIVKDGIAADVGGASCSNEGGSQLAYHGHHQQMHGNIHPGADLPVLHLEDGDLGNTVNVTVSRSNAGKAVHTPKLHGLALNKKFKVTPSTSGCQDVRASHPRKSSMSLVAHDSDDDFLPSNVNNNKNTKSSSAPSKGKGRRTETQSIDCDATLWDEIMDFAQTVVPAPLSPLPASPKKNKVSAGKGQVKPSASFVAVPLPGNSALQQPSCSNAVLPPPRNDALEQPGCSNAVLPPPPEVAPIVNENPLPAQADSDSESEVFSQVDTKTSVKQFFKIYGQLKRTHDLNLRLCRDHPKILRRAADMRERAAKLEADVKRQREALDKTAKQMRFISDQMGG